MARLAPNDTDRQFDLVLRITERSLRDLYAGGFRLCAFKSVHCDQRGGGPVLWASAGQPAPFVKLAWQERYYAFAGHRELAPGADYLDAQQLPVEVGATVDAVRVPGTPSGVHLKNAGRHGEPGLIAVRNTGAERLVCGLAQPSPRSDRPVPLSAFTLYGSLNTVVIAPLPKVVLSFTAEPLHVGAVVPRLFAPAVVVDLASQSTIVLDYDLDGGWSGNGDLARYVPPGTFLSAVIEP
jgi:hypothetical protein